MSTLRMSLAGMVMLALLGGLTGAATDAASDDAASSGPAIVSGYLYKPGGHWVGVDEFEDAWVVKHKEVDGDLQMDDPRLSGAIYPASTYHEMRGSGHRVFSGTVEITSDLGSWVGIRQGYEPAPGLHEWVVELTGEGGHEGLSAMLFFEEDPDKHGSNLVSGILYVGHQPPLPQLPAE